MPIKRLAISCLFAFAVFLSSFGGTLRAAGPGFAAMAGEPGAVEAGFRLPPRSALVPYPSREEALAGGTSSYVIPLEEWQRDSVPEGVRYTARFKVRYAWDNRARPAACGGCPLLFRHRGKRRGGRIQSGGYGAHGVRYHRFHPAGLQYGFGHRLRGSGRPAVSAKGAAAMRKAGGGGPGCCLSPRYGYTTCLPRLRWTAVTVMWRSISSCRVSC